MDLSIDIPRDYRIFLQNLLKLKHNWDYDKIKEILDIKSNKNHNPVIASVSNSNNADNNRMILLLNDNPIIARRIWVDEDTNIILSKLYTITDNVIYDQQLIDTIIHHWDFAIINYNHPTNRIIRKCSANEYYIQIYVSEVTWDEFKEMCKTLKLEIRDGFKSSIYLFLDDRSKKLC